MKICPGARHLTQSVAFETFPDVCMMKALSHICTEVSTYCYMKICLSSKYETKKAV